MVNTPSLEKRVKVSVKRGSWKEDEMFTIAGQHVLAEKKTIGVLSFDPI